MTPDRTLFSSLELHNVLEHNMQQACQEVDSISEEQFRASQDEELIEHVYSCRELLPITLHEDQTTMSPPKEVLVENPRNAFYGVLDGNRQRRVPGVRISVTIPFTGEPHLWECRPNPFTLSPPHAQIHKGSGTFDGFLVIVLEGSTDAVGNGERFKNELDCRLTAIRNQLITLRGNLAGYDKSLRGRIQQSVMARRERLGKQADIISTLGIPLSRNPNAPSMEHLPIRRKLVKPLPTKATAPPEPGIATEDFEHILKVIRHEGRSFETTPATFAMHDEEGLRDIIVAHLNGHYEGGASGETFRKSGKTDIRIEDGNRAAFVAECKVWRGQSEVGAALDQLLGYLTWRDCKAALIIFNKDVATFARIQEKLKVAIRKHPSYETESLSGHAGEWRFGLHSAEDADHKIILHVLMFNLYVGKTGGQRK